MQCLHSTAATGRTPWKWRGGTETETPRDLERDRNGSWLGASKYIFPLSVQILNLHQHQHFAAKARSGYCQGRNQHQTVYTMWPRTFSSLGEPSESLWVCPQHPPRNLVRTPDVFVCCNDLTGRPHHMVGI